jgi:penicillin amidase
VFARKLGLAALEPPDALGMLVALHFEALDDVLLRERSAWYGAEGRDACWRRVAAEALARPARSSRSLFSLRLLNLAFAGRGAERVGRVLGFHRGPLAVRGGRATVHQVQRLRALGRATVIGPSIRWVTDLAERAVHSILPGGPSDRALSRWYASEVDRWAKGELKRVEPIGAVAPPKR